MQAGKARETMIVGDEFGDTVLDTKRSPLPLLVSSFQSWSSASDSEFRRRNIHAGLKFGLPRA